MLFIKFLYCKNKIKSKLNNGIKIKPASCEKLDFSKEILNTALSFASKSFFASFDTEACINQLI